MTAASLAGEQITAKLTAAPGNGARIGGLKVTTENAWFAARPSGTEDVVRESFRGSDHLAQVQDEAREVVSAALAGCAGSAPMSSLPLPPAWSGPLPEASPPAAAWRSTSSRPAPTRLGRRSPFEVGTSETSGRFATLAILVRHPRGDLLVDAGSGARVATHVATLPRMRCVLRMTQPGPSANSSTPATTTATSSSASW